MANQQVNNDEILDIEHYLSYEKAVKSAKKKTEKEKSGKKGNFKPDDDRKQDEHQQINTLNKNHNGKEKKEASVDKIMDSRKFLSTIAKESLERFKNNNKRLKFHKERIDILKAEMKKYIKIGNKEAAEKCQNEINRLQEEYDISINAFEQTKKEDYEKFFDKINVSDIKKELKQTKQKLDEAIQNSDADAVIKLQDMLNEQQMQLEDAQNHNMWLDEKKEIKLKLKEINESLRTANFSTISRIMTNISDTRKALQKIENKEEKEQEDYEALEDLLYKEDIESSKEIEDEINLDEDDAEESDYLYKLNELTKLPINERIDALAKLIRSIIPQNLKNKYPLSEIKLLIEQNKQKIIKDIISRYKNEKEIESIKAQKEQLENELNTLNSKLKKNANIVDFIFEYLHYDESNENEQKLSKDILIQYAIIWSQKIVNSLISKNNITDSDFISDLIAEAALQLSIFTDKWFQKRKEGYKREFFNYLAVPIRQNLIKFIVEWRSHGTITGSSARTLDHDFNKRLESIKVELTEKYGKNPLTGKLDQVWEEYAYELAAREDTLSLVQNASDFEAMIGGKSGDEDKVDFGSYVAKSELDSIEAGEAKIAHNELIKNMAEFLSMFELDKKTKKKQQIFDKQEILIFQLELGLIYNKQTGKNYTQAECAKILTQYSLANNLPIGKDLANTEANFGKPKSEWTISSSAYNTRKIDLFGNYQLVLEGRKRAERYEKGLTNVKPSKTDLSRKLVRGKLFDVLDKNPQLKQVFSDLIELIGTRFIRELSASEDNNLMDNIDSTREAKLKLSEDESLINGQINVDLVVGDTNYDDNEFADVWTNMIDFTGINI